VDRLFDHSWDPQIQRHRPPYAYRGVVAAHFTTCEIEKFNEDGAIWCVNFIKVNQLLPGKLRGLLAEEGALQLNVEILNKAARSLKEFDALASDDFVVFFDPPSLDDRIVNQYAVFSVLSDPKGLLDDWLKRYPSLYQKIIIPASLKWKIRDKLDKSNINERMLFPGLDGLATWLKRYYSPRLRYKSPENLSCQK